MGQVNNLDNANLFSDPTPPNSGNGHSPSNVEIHILPKSACILFRNMMPPSKTFLADESTKPALRLLEYLQSLGPIKSQSDLNALKHRIAQYVDTLPGPMTPQKFADMDHDPELDLLPYGKILDLVVATFDTHWPISGNTLDPLIRRLMIVEGGTIHTLHEVLATLTNILKETEDESVVDTLVIALSEVVKSDALTSALVNSAKSRDQDLLEKENVRDSWKNLAQILSSLPSRVANKVKRKLPDVFRPQDYIKIFIFHFARALDFLGDGVTHLKEVNPNMSSFSLLLGKFALLAGSEPISPLVDILSSWSLDKPHLQELVKEVLLGVDRRSVQVLAVSYLRRGDHPESILAKLLEDPTWHYTLTTKIVFSSWYEDERLPRNLVQCLAEGGHLVQLLKKTLEVWGNRSALNHAPLGQHLYLTKLLLLGIEVCKNKLTSIDRNDLKTTLMTAIPAHLESAVVEIRAIGMIVGEILVGNLDTTKLEFEYEGMSEDALKLVEDLKGLTLEVPKAGKSMPEVVVGDVEFLSSGHKVLFDLGVECGILKAVPQENGKMEVVEEKEKEKEIFIKERVEEEVLDSDDDLEPYDMSNDTKASERLGPSYLRDLKENLINTENSTNPEIFQESLKVCESLILEQLPGDDASLALELLVILYTLQERSSVEDFDILVLNSCISIVTIFPKECAQHLCQEFHSEVAKYSLDQRVYFLRILSEAAKRLSRIEPRKAQKKVLPRPKKISKTVSLMIETDKTRKREVVYDDLDFDSGMLEDALDWEEVVRKRVEEKTRVFAHQSKLVQGVENRFGNVASYFFYPLLYGFGRKGACMYEFPRAYADQENILLVSFLETLSVIMVATQNCAVAGKLGKEILELSWALRYHENARVRLSVIENIAAVLVALDEKSVDCQVGQLLMEMRAWLVEAQNAVRGDCDVKCKRLGRSVLSLIDAGLGLE